MAAVGAGGAGDRLWQSIDTGMPVLPAVVQAAVTLTPDEESTVRVYRSASPGVVNITTTAVAYDFFLNPIPKEGAGSGAIIDRSGNILTNFHVIDGARRLEVTLADGSKW